MELTMKFSDDPDTLEEFLDAFHGQDYRRTLDYVDTYCRNKCKYSEGLALEVHDVLTEVREIIRRHLEDTPWRG